MRLIYGTGNPAKLSAMQKRLSGFDLEIVGLKDLNIEIPEVPETGSSPLENAYQKAAAYYKLLMEPVFSCDSGLYFDQVPDEVQPGVHVRNINGRTLTDDEMLEYYSGLAKEYGDLTARYRNAICLIVDDNHIYRAMEESMASEPFLMKSKPHIMRKEGFPLDSLSVDIKTGKYYYDLDKNELDTVAVEDGFLEFFQTYIDSVVKRKIALK
ncbi:non-canonical purine NTP pyrophosphatase [Lacrimispora sp. 38-1]|uniref:non-canonical purine NTP pyrophosphatase n=1 Tax=Lacrimispora sp. 38-1 TaxID=3125778 RepID=UPI003CFA984D